MRYYLLLLILLAVPALAEQATITVSKYDLYETVQGFTILPASKLPIITEVGIDPPSLLNKVTLELDTKNCLRFGVDECAKIKLCVSLNRDITTLQCKPVIANKNTIDFEYPTRSASVIGVGVWEKPPNIFARYKITLKKVVWGGGEAREIKRDLLSLRSTGPIDLGPIIGWMDTKGYTGEFLVGTDDSRVVAWFDDGSGSPTSTTSSSEELDHIFLCLNEDRFIDPDLEEPICDYEDERRCMEEGKDWYAGAAHCCGDAPYNPRTDGKTCAWYPTEKAFCGEDPGGIWVWAAIEEKGKITELTPGCPNIQADNNFQLVSDGQKFYTCSDITPTQKIQGKQEIGGHEYVCDGNDIVECGGLTPYSENGKATGDTIDINGETNYCTKEGKWVVSLDGTDKESCITAGLIWTGTKCCGEEDDALGTYEDPPGANFKGEVGVCYENKFYSAGQSIESKEITSYKGKFYVCAPDNKEPDASKTLFQNTGITPKITAACGKPLPNAKQNGQLNHIICTPEGNWFFVGSKDDHVAKTIKWGVQGTENQQGCCLDDQCWGGQGCRDIGDIYELEDRGFRCQ